MNGINKVFMSNPLFFLEQIMVDNATKAQEGTGPNDIAKLNAAKKGVFDLTSIASDVLEKSASGDKKVYLHYAVDGITLDDPIETYWCPFLQGNGVPGWVDVPRSDPAHRLVLTAAMQGCAFVISDSPNSADRFRVYHNQHPKGTKTWAAMKKDTPEMKIISIFSEDPAELPKEYQQYSIKYRYGNPAAYSNGTPTNAFNLLWYTNNGDWAYLSQSNIFKPAAKSYTIERDKGMPILAWPTGVGK